MSRPTTSFRWRFMSLAVLGGLSLAASGLAHGWRLENQRAVRVLAVGERPDDRRLGPLRDLDTHCPFSPPSSLQQWQDRAVALRRQLRVALGLWPWPTRTPLNAQITGTIERDDYIVEKVILESLPGHFVTGNVYRPKTEGRHAAVLTPHGHWPNGRFEDQAGEEAAKSLSTGAEPFESAARFPMQARAVQLARLGAVTFLIDMVGYADSVQIPRSVAHEFAKARPAESRSDSWLFYSPQAELHLQSIMGLQTWNSIRALDYLAARDDVDPKRIGVTGDSGGGTQTFILGAIDDRPAAIFPAVMVATAMQGGCTCENASYLRIGTGNVEIAAIGAPRPLGMTAADDWTKDMESDGFPSLQTLYDLFDRRQDVALHAYLQFPHNYNAVSRAAMNEWFNRHLKLGWSPVPAERPFQPLTKDESTVWTASRPAPEPSEDAERAVTTWMTSEASKALAPLLPPAHTSHKELRDVVGSAWLTLLGDPLEGSDRVTFESRADTTAAWGTTTTAILRRSRTGAALPAVLLSPRKATPHILVWVADEGTAALFDTSGAPTASVSRVLAAGVSVLGVDLLEQGEFQTDATPFSHARLASPRAHAGYTFGYNHPLPAERVQDILTAVRAARARVGPDGLVCLIGRGATSGLAAGARMLARSEIDRAVFDVAGFRFAEATRIDDPNFLPGAAKYGDVPALVALAAPLPTWVIDTKGPYPTDDESLGLRVTLSGAPPPLVEEVDWLLRQK